MSVANEISDTLSAPPPEIQEEDLLQELEELNEQELDKATLCCAVTCKPVTTSSPAYTSSTPTYTTASQNTTPPKAVQSKNDADILQCVVRLQSADGYWNWTVECAELLHIKHNEETLNKIQAILPQSAAPLTEALRPSLLCTLLVLAWLHKTLPKLRDEWELLSDKAIEWASSHLQVGSHEIPKLFQLLYSSVFSV